MEGKRGKRGKARIVRKVGGGGGEGGKPRMPAPRASSARTQPADLCEFSRPGVIPPLTVFYLEDFARLLGKTPKALRNMILRGLVPKPAKLGGRLVWSRATVLHFLAEIHAAEQTSATPVNINARPYTYDPSRMLVTFEIPRTATEPRKRVRKVAPAGLDMAGALAWGRKLERDVLAEVFGHKEEAKPQHTALSPVSVVARVAARTAPTLAEFWGRFELEALPGFKPATRKGYLSAWRNYLGPVLGSVPIDMIDRGTLAKLREAIGKLEPASRNQVLAKLRTIMETAETWGLIAEAPTIKKEKQGKDTEPEAYSATEAAALVAAAEAEGRVALAIVLLGLRAGLRVSEICALRWSDLDLPGRTMTIRHNYSAGHESTPKGGRAAPVGLAPDLVAALAALPKRGDHVLVRTFRGEQCPHTPHSITHLLHALQDAAGLPHAGPHKLRHTCVTDMARGGAPSAMMQRQARHARLSTTERYIHLAAEEAAVQAADFWAAMQAPAQSRPKRPKRAEIAAMAVN